MIYLPSIAQAWEDTYPAVAAAMGVNTSGRPTIKFDLTNKSYVNALEDLTLARREAEGIDFFWIDWQQGEDKGNTGQDGPRLKMNPTIWLNKMRVTDAKRRCVNGIGVCSRKRGVVFGRFGGLGNHRYQHGFSGDVHGLTWANLAYQAYFSATASNVGFGLWSHDLVGPGDDHELYARWLQLGAYQSIMRMHDRGMSAGGCRGWPSRSDGCDTVRPWNVPSAFADANEAALRLRAALVPYAYTAAREAFDSGIGLTRPLYYYWPEEAGAYPESMDGLLGQTPGTRQYMFGPSLLVAPVTGPGACANLPQASTHRLDAPCGLSSMDIYLPYGDWFDMVAGAFRRGPTNLTASVHLQDTPVFARSGAVVARRPLPQSGSLVGLAASAYHELEWTLYPGGDGGDGSAQVYEDDGETIDYLPHEGAWHTWVKLRYAWDAPNASVELTVEAEGSEGHWRGVQGSSGEGAVGPGPPKVRAHSFVLPCTLPPANVTIDGAVLPFLPLATAQAAPAVGSVGLGLWTYDGASLATIIHLSPRSASKEAKVTVVTPRAASHTLSGLAGMIKAARRAKAVLDAARIAPGAQVVDHEGAPLDRLAMAGANLAVLARDATSFVHAVSDVSKLHASASTELRRRLSHEESNENKARLTYALQILAAAKV